MSSPVGLPANTVLVGVKPAATVAPAAAAAAWPTKCRRVNLSVIGESPEEGTTHGRLTPDGPMAPPLCAVRFRSWHGETGPAAVFNMDRDNRPPLHTAECGSGLEFKSSPPEMPWDWSTL